MQCSFWTMHWHKLWNDIFGYKPSTELRFIRHVPTLPNSLLLLFVRFSCSQSFFIVIDIALNFPFGKYHAVSSVVVDTFSCACCFSSVLAIYNVRKTHMHTERSGEWWKIQRWKSINHLNYTGVECHTKWFVLNSFDPSFVFKMKICLE